LCELEPNGEHFLPPRFFEAISQIPFKLMRIGLMMGESGFSHLCTLMKTPVFAGKKSATALPSGAGECAGSIAFYLYADPLGLKTQASHRESLTNPGDISKPELR
jgi:hypothetical protein